MDEQLKKRLCCADYSTANNPDCACQCHFIPAPAFVTPKEIRAMEFAAEAERLSDTSVRPYYKITATGAEKALEALLATEYDRGKVDGAIEELKPIAEWEGAMFEEDVRAYVLTRQAKLKSKGEVKSE